jgi:predicted TIM-barrel fold metal-dependent hydrolase
MAIDLHAHWVPQTLADALRRRGGAVPRIEPAGEGGERLVMPIGTLAFHEQYVEPRLRLDFMDRHGIERQVLSLPGLFGIDSLAADEATPLVRLFNEASAELCGAHPGRFSALAALPLADMAAAVAELRRARQQPGCVGAILPVDSFLSQAQAAHMAPLFDAAASLGAHFFVHPGRGPGRGPLPPAPPDHDLARRALAVQHEVGQAMVTLLLSDFLDGWPGVTVQVANLGGTFPAVVERMDHMMRLRNPSGTLPSSRARRVWVDCSSLGARSLEQAVGVFGADRVVFGTDCPIFDTGATLAAIRDARLSGKEREQILAVNARELLARIA